MLIICYNGPPLGLLWVVYNKGHQIKKTIMQHFHLDTKHSQALLGPFQFPLKYENDGINGSFAILYR